MIDRVTQKVQKGHKTGHKPKDDEKITKHDWNGSTKLHGSYRTYPVVEVKKHTPPALDVKHRRTRKTRKFTDEQEEEQVQEAIKVNRIPGWRIFYATFMLHLN